LAIIVLIHHVGPAKSARWQVGNFQPTDSIDDGDGGGRGRPTMDDV
jgi:hypothetical protein